ncbi:LysR substrate-binding domain-containing protein [Microvirga sp. 2MCAF38]|uniref:LysR substrate-binding domain-containing protein n=1 Tax=Microvirga sp. 2MCAF38 TaxID=3232989 RepID=UPI003F945C6B
MIGQIPSLNALRAFEMTARTGSMLRAAEALFVTQSAVSRHIRTLEQDLGCALFRRVHRGLVLTPQGEALAETLSEAFERIGERIARLRKRPETLRLRVPPTFGIRWLMPRLPRFETRHPDTKIEVNITWDELEPDTLDFDVGVRCEPGRWPAACLTELMIEQLTPVCSPQFLQNWVGAGTSEALSTVPLLHCTSHRTDWRQWAKGWSGEDFPVDRGEVFGTLDLAQRAAEAGRGLAIADLAMVADDLRLGRLVTPFPDNIVTGATYFFVHRASRRDMPVVEAFRQWLLEEVAETNT